MWTWAGVSIGAMAGTVLGGAFVYGLSVVCEFVGAEIWLMSHPWIVAAILLIPAALGGLLGLDMFAVRKSREQVRKHIRTALPAE